jgi:hypothetical protein
MKTKMLAFYTVVAVTSFCRKSFKWILQSLLSSWPSNLARKCYAKVQMANNDKHNSLLHCGSDSLYSTIMQKVPCLEILTLPTNIRLEYKWLIKTKMLAFYTVVVVTSFRRKSFKWILQSLL